MDITVLGKLINLEKEKDYLIVKDRPVLSKAGAEKIIQSLGLSVEVSYTVHEFSGNLCIVIKAILYKDAEPISVGLGGADSVEKKVFNTAVKVGKKRAIVDAVLSLGLSSMFTQDLDEQGYDVSEDDEPLASEKQLDFLKRNGYDVSKKWTKSEASKTISEILNKNKK